MEMPDKKSRVMLKRFIKAKQMKSLLRFGALFVFWSLFAFLDLSIGIYAQNPGEQRVAWPERYSATFGFEIMADHNGKIIVSSVDTISRAWKLGVRPAMEVLGWNTLPVRRKLDSMKVRRFLKQFPVMTEENIRLMLLTRGRPGERAEVFFMKPSGNNWGILLRAFLN
jgi:hypothetical protein